MTDEERKQIVSDVLAALKQNSTTIDQMLEKENCADDDFFETNKGNKISFKTLSKGYNEEQGAVGDAIRYQFKRSDGKKLYPQTSSACVTMSDGDDSLDTRVKNITTEYNVSLFHPKQGIDGSNKYTLSSAIALVPEKYRSIGIKCSFLNEDGQGECWEYKGGSWNVGSFSQVGEKEISKLSDKCAINRILIENLSDKTVSSISGLRDIDLTNLRTVYGYIFNDTWNNNPSVKSVVIPVDEYTRYIIDTKSAINFAVLANYNPNEEVIYADGQSMSVLPVGESIISIGGGAKSITFPYKDGDNILINSLRKEVYSRENNELEKVNSLSINIDNYTKINGFSSNGKWFEDNTVKTVIIPVHVNELYEIKVTKDANLSFITSDNPKDTTYLENLIMSSSGTNHVTAPINAKYMTLVCELDGVVIVESILKITSSVKYATVYKGLFEKGYIGAAGQIKIYGTYKTTGYIPLLGSKKIKVTMIRVLEENSDTGLVFYDANHKVIDDSINPSYTNKKENNNWIKYMVIYVPNGACYFRVTTWGDDFSEENGIDNTVSYILYDDRESYYITKGFVKNEYQENVIKRAIAFTNVRWCPVADLPRCCTLSQNYSNSNAFFNGVYLDNFKANKHYNGIPYSFAGRSDMGGNPLSQDFGRFALEVGHDVPFEAFVTAARNPKSFLYDKAKFEAIYSCIPFGADCVGMAAYAMNWEYNNNIANDFRNDDLTKKIGDVETMDLSLIRPADFLVCNFHTALITDVYYENDELMIEVGEENSEGGATNSPFYSGESGGISYRKLYNANNFRDWCKIYEIRRLKNFAKFETTYIPDEFAPLDNSQRKPIVDLACMPYMGNAFRFIEGHIPEYAKKILINANGFKKLVVYRDNELMEEYEISDETEYINVPFTLTGEYIAFLTREDGLQTRECKWFVDPQGSL